MSLLSSNKVSLFNETLLNLIKVMIEQGWNAGNRNPDYGSMLLDNMQFSLDPVQRPYEDLIEAFKRQNNDENLEEYEELVKQVDYMRQRRVMMTPTLMRFSAAQEEQTNRVIREYHSLIQNFVRLSFVTEDFDKGYYFGGF
jgi:hypothetical protein